MSCLYVPGLVDSTLESTLPYPTPAPSVMWRSKPLRPRSFARAWMTRPWLRRLSAPTCEPSTVQRGLERWISSARDTRASRSASPADVLGRMIPGTCGPTWRESLENAEQLGLFSRTSPAIYRLGSIPSQASFTEWVSGLRREYSARRRLVRRIAESGCSSSRTVTPDHWPTSTVTDTAYEQSPRSGVKGNHNLALPIAVGQWPTPRAGDSESPGPHHGHADSLHSSTADWRTPASRDWKGESAASWRTRTDGDTIPTLSDQVASCGLLAPGGIGPESIPECGQPSQWPTPTAQADAGSRNTEGSKAHPGTGLADAALTGSSASGRQGNRRRLNPLFVEWLMGWPRGWTDFGPVATEWCPWLQRMRSALSALPWLKA